MTKPKWKEVRVLKVRSYHRVFVAPMRYDRRKALRLLVIGFGLAVFALVGRPVLGDFTGVIFFVGLSLSVLGYIIYGSYDIIRIDTGFSAPAIDETILLDGQVSHKNYEERATILGKRTFVPVK